MSQLVNGVSQSSVTPELIDINTPFTMYCNCSVTYHGRGISTLQTGNYLIIHKLDGAFMIHGPTHAPPLNYQKHGARLYRRPTGGVLISRSKRETVTVQIYRIAWLQKLELWSDRRIEITRTERELVDKLHTNLLQYIPNITFREIKREAMTTAGPIDLLAVGSDDTYHVFEAKRATISVNSVAQVKKYILALSEAGHNCIGYVVAPNISTKALKYAEKYDIGYIQISHDI